MNTERLFGGVLIAITLVFLPGCPGMREGKEEAAHQPVVARIGDYALTVADFEEEEQLYLPYIRMQEGAEPTKERLLEMMIRKHVLLQEARRLDLDKDGAFMKGVEHYWKQALLTSLIKKKMEALAGTITVSPSEIAHERAYAERRLLVRTFLFSSEKPAATLSAAGAEFEEAMGRARPDILFESAEAWLEPADLAPEMREAVFSLPKGRCSRPLPQEGRWQVLCITGEESGSVSASDEALKEMAERLKKEKIAAAMEEWVTTLIEDASVKVNSEALSRVRLDPAGEKGNDLGG